MFQDKWIIEIKSWNDWKIVTLVACTHWDELIWDVVFKFLLNDFNIKEKIKKWSLNLVIWNLEWFKIWKKYIDKDFNRIWELKEEDKEKYEYKRANEIKDIIIKSDFLFDLHSTTNPSPFFLIPNWKFEKNYLESFNCEYVVEDILNFLHWKPLVSYVSDNNEKSETMVMECFWERKEEEKIYINNVINYLNKTWIIEEKLPFEIERQKPTIFKVKKAIHAKSMDVVFKYSENPKSFDFVKTWELVFTDWNESYFAENDFTILMPTKPRYIWEEIMYILEKA